MHSTLRASTSSSTQTRFCGSAGVRSFLLHKHHGDSPSSHQPSPSSLFYPSRKIKFFFSTSQTEMGDDGNSSSTTGFSTGTANKLTGLLIVFAVFVLLTIVLIFIVYVYTRLDWGIRSTASRRRWRSSETRVNFFIAAGNARATTSVGLESSVLSSLPVAIYRASEFKEAHECAVCLTELADGEKVRLLPICNHGFHLDCIDMWFHSHSTCPICRLPVLEGRLSEPGALPAEGSAVAGEEMLSISIPVRSAEMLLSSSSLLPSRGSQPEEMKSPAEEAISPELLKVRSLRRILSRGKKTGGSASFTNPRVGDIENGMLGSGASNGEGS